MKCRIILFWILILFTSVCIGQDLTNYEVSKDVPATNIFQYTIQGKNSQMGIEPVYYKDGMFYINGPTWTEQTIEF